MSAIILDPLFVCIDEQLRRAPADLVSGGFPAILDRMTDALPGDEHTVLVTPEYAEALALPRKIGDNPDSAERACHPLAVSLRKGGWECRGIGRWFSAWKPAVMVRIGIFHLMENPCDNSPWACIWNPDDDRAPGVPWGAWTLDRTATLAAWQRLTGAAWYGSPGQAANQVLIRLNESSDRKKVPTWKPGRSGQKCWPDGDPIEWAINWRSPCAHIGKYEHTYDKRRAYLAALSCAEVARWSLRHTGKIAFNPRLGGWWLVDAAEWSVKELPAPHGRETGGEMWVTTPTVKLLMDLADAGVYGGVRILDSWTSFASRGILRQFAQTLSKVWDADVPDDNDRARLRAMVKGAYRQAYGMWRSDRSAIYRPDWAAAVIAISRSNEWRKFFHYWEKTGIAPVAWDTDAVTYAADIPDPTINTPAGIKLTDTLGSYRASTRKVRR